MKKNISQNLLSRFATLDNDLDDLANESLTVSRPLYRFADVLVSLIYHPLQVLLHDPHLASCAQLTHTTERKFAWLCIVGTFQTFLGNFSVVKNPGKYFPV